MTSEGSVRGRRELVLVVLGFGSLTVLLLLPLASHLGSVGRVDNADTRFLIWNVAWVARTLVVDPLHVLDANIFHPHQGTLAYSETNLGAGLLAMPVYWATGNPYAAHNFVVLSSFVMSATGAYYLTRYLVGDRRVAAIVAIGFAYCPYAFARLPHVHLLMTAGLPLSMLAFHRAVDRPTLERGAALGLAMAAQALFCGYYGVFVALTVGFAVPVIAVTAGRATDTRYWTAIAIAAATALGLALPLFLPYKRLQTDAGFGRSLDEARQWSATWRAYIASSAYAHAWMLPLIQRWNDVLFPGFFVAIGGAAGVVAGWLARGRRRQLAMLYGGLAAAAFWASFGPDAGLYSALYGSIPPLSLLRTPSRFGIVVVLALSVLASLVLSALFARLDGWSIAAVAGPRPARVPGRIPLAGIVAGLLAAAVVAELRVPLSFTPVAPVEEAYRVLATLPRGPVIEIPFYSTRFASERTQYMLGSTVHWMPLIGGYSSHVPRDVLDRTETLGQFPSREAFALLRRDGVRYAVFHLNRLPDDTRPELIARLQSFAPYLRCLYADDRVWLYEVVGFPD